MESERVIVFSSHTIFAEGVMSRLRQHPDGGAIHFIDTQDEGYIEKIAALKPSIVVVDFAHDNETDCHSLCELLKAFANLTIIRLKIREKDVQVITSSPHRFENVQGLIDLMQP